MAETETPRLVTPARDVVLKATKLAAKLKVVLSFDPCYQIISDPSGTNGTENAITPKALEVLESNHRRKLVAQNTIDLGNSTSLVRILADTERVNVVVTNIEAIQEVGIECMVPAPAVIEIIVGSSMI